MQDVRDAEQTHDVARVQAARLAASAELYDLLDGAERALARRIEEAEQGGMALLVSVRALAKHHDALREHPATQMGWHLLSFADAEEHGRYRFAVVLQLGPRNSVVPDPLPHSGLRILYMAFSPRDVEPVLDFEGEEERFLEVLAPFVQAGRALVRVVEDGTLEDLMRALLLESYDVVHLSGHGLMTSHGPQLVMEDDTGMRRRNLDGTPADVSPASLIEALRRAESMPSIVMLSNCHSAESRDAMPSFAVELVAAGVPAVLGWTRPVRDDQATEVTSDIYQQLAAGRPLPMAVELARDLLRRREAKSPQRSHTWTTLALVTGGAAGVRIDRQAPPLPALIDASATYQFLERSPMRVLRRGFVGRRRPLQRIVRLLRDGMFAEHDGAAQRAVAGLVVWGMKGVGKSCLVARAVERVRQHDPELGMIVLHGALDDTGVVRAFQRLAIDHWHDAEAEKILASVKESVLLRVRRVLARWRDRGLVLIFDDFEQNIELRNDGPSRLHPYAAELLDTLLPACQLGRPKLLITTTAIFAVPGPEPTVLGELRLGPLEPASVRKLWMRGPSASEHIPVSLGQWELLAARLGRNGRILSWARDLLSRKTSEELVTIAARAAATVPVWEPGDETRQAKHDELASLFLRHMAHEEARATVGSDVQFFLQRVRVYEVAVPVDAFVELTEGLTLDLDRDLVALANLGLLEVGELDGQRAYRVSPLVEPKFTAERPEHWHSIASRYWWQVAHADEASPAFFERVGYSWRHALAGRHAQLADQAGRDIHLILHESGFYAENLQRAEEHLAALPDSPFGALWVGDAENYAAGPTQRAHDLLQNALRRLIEAHGTENHPEVAACLHALGGVLHAQGRLPAARAIHERALEIQVAVHGTDKHLSVAVCLHALGIVFDDQGDFPGARAALERSLAIKAELLGSDKFPEVAAGLHVLASVLTAQGDYGAARAALERSLAIKAELFGSENHPDIAATLQALGGVLLAQGELPAARAALERALAIEREVHGTEKHLSVAVCLHALGDVFLASGDVPAARAAFARALAVKLEVYGTDRHASIATSLYALGCVLQTEGDLASAYNHLKRALEIQIEVHGTEKHPYVASGFHALGGVLLAQGELAAARAALERSLEIKFELHVDDDHRSIAAGLHVLGNILFQQGDLRGARAALERSLAITIELHGASKHFDVSSGLHSLSMVCLVEGKLQDAVMLLRRALDIEERCFGSLEQYHSAEIEAALAMVLLRLQQHDEARGRLAHAVPLLAAVNPHHPMVLQYAAWINRR
ncbi:tetratricopeptide repeat protein [Nannocystis punicea]|uniref:Tetratricopeptide repeat protein n=1 Tax=Nannocystis punicea TaxID=2995304 RepID=A0ABY7HCK0_9BACT|nr:tetratricopeptide repeat protein [Nannocystis poenicansa]WAS96989.1 tetratricopeptide repeat protein [Nannocystis poenicansa]